MSGSSPPAAIDTPEARLRCYLEGLALFAELPAATLDELAVRGEAIALAGGTTLFEQDETADAFYLLRWGRLAAWRRNRDGDTRRLGQIGPGEYVGEVGLILDQRRSATVFALRDSELVRWSRDSFEQLLAHHPKAMLGLTREALKRYAATVERPAEVRCFAVLPGTPGVDARAFAQRLAQALHWLGRVELVQADTARHRGAGWFSRMEQDADGLIYVGDSDPQWRERCVRQSDAVLLLADTDDKPANALPAPASRSQHTPLHLVLQRRYPPQAGETRPWLEAFSDCASHHHLRDDADMVRLARLLGGRATALMLSGGGARGFAHIGVLRAMREHGIDIDYVGGCSAGAVVGAGIAAGWDEAQLVEALRIAFVDDNPLSDRTIPLVAMSSGRKVSQLLKRMFGERDIGDLQLPFFCVSSDLTEGALHVHERGKLWIALRASSAIPGMVPPVFHDRRVLVDGGVIDNLPVSEMRQRMNGRIIAVDVGGNYRIDTELEATSLPSWWRQILLQWRHRTYPGIGRILWRAGMVNSAATVAHQRRQSSLLLAPQLDGIDLLGWQQFERAIELGYQYAQQSLERGDHLQERPDATPGL